MFSVWLLANALSGALYHCCDTGILFISIKGPWPLKHFEERWLYHYITGIHIQLWEDFIAIITLVSHSSEGGMFGWGAFLVHGELQV